MSTTNLLQVRCLQEMLESNSYSLLVILKNHLSKPYVNLDRTLMTRMVRAAVQCPGLTIPQKKGVLLAG